VRRPKLELGSSAAGKKKRHYKLRCLKQVSCVIQRKPRIIIARITPSFLCCPFTGCFWLTITCISHLNALTTICLYLLIPPQSFEEHVVPTFHLKTSLLNTVNYSTHHSYLALNYKKSTHVGVSCVLHNISTHQCNLMT